MQGHHVHSHEELFLSDLIHLPCSSIITLRHTRWNIPLINSQAHSARPITGQQVQANEDEPGGQKGRGGSRERVSDP